MKTPTKAELLAERQEIIAALAKRDPPQFDEEFPLVIRIEEIVKREKALCDTIKHKVAALRELRVRAYFGTKQTQGQME